MATKLTVGMAAWLLLGALAQAQFSQSSQDLIALEDKVVAAERAVERMSASSSTDERQRAERELGELKDDLAYLRVKSRRGDRISDAEREKLNAALTDFTAKLDKQASGQRHPRELPVGTELDVRLQGGLNSGTVNIEDRVTATTVVDLYKGDMLLVPAGSVLSGIVTAVDRASRTDRTGRLSVRFDRLRVGERTYEIQGAVVDALKSDGLKGEAGRIGVGAGVGAILGGILGGTKGAIAGILIGAGGAVVATEGKDVDLPAGTVLRVRLDSALVIE